MIRRQLRKATEPPPGLTDDQVFARLQALDAATAPSDPAASRAAVWARVTAEHPELAAPRPVTGRPVPLRAARPTGWRRMFDVAAAAAIVVILLFGLQGVSFLPDDQGTIPLGTQSAAAATPTGTIPAIDADDQIGAAPMVLATPPWAGVQHRSDRQHLAVGTTPP
ncbi:MAG TPA: hypothetical protein VGT61_10955 [Thermomicrobiales bacterium]|jgi:hypothetical protein|nr:hypothetical protein [Thermomicrobiales bacterium]